MLPCKVYGHPEPIVSWFKKYSEITADSLQNSKNRIIIAQNNSLIIHNVTDTDEATYSCRATSGTKAVVKEAIVTVFGKYFFNKIYN